MPSEAPILAKRPRERVLIAIPVQVSRYAADGTPLRERGETLVVSQHGALLRLPSRPALDTSLEVLNCYSNEAARFRVAYVDAESKDGHSVSGWKCSRTATNSGTSNSHPNKARASHPRPAPGQPVDRTNRQRGRAKSNPRLLAWARRRTIRQADSIQNVYRLHRNSRLYFPLGGRVFEHHAFAAGAQVGRPPMRLSRGQEI